MISTEQLAQLLKADESDILERKASLADEEKIRSAMIAFANDLAGRGGGKLIIGQNPDKTIAGLSIDADTASRKISELARNRCFPAIPVVIDFSEYEGKQLAIIEVPVSAARPHFRGDCYVRQGSTNRTATSAEIMVLRSAGIDPKLRQLLAWQQQGKTTISLVQLPILNWGKGTAELLEVNDTYIVLKFNPTFSLSVSIAEAQLGYDAKNSRPQITFVRHS